MLTVIVDLLSRSKNNFPVTSIYKQMIWKRLKYSLDLIFLMDLGKKKVSAASGGRQAKEKMGY